MIEVSQLKKVFENQYTALRSVDFTIKKGDLVCLLGPSGCGKSTILNVIAGLLQPTAGDIKFAGQSIVGVEPKNRGIGFVFQNYALYPHMTVLENVMFPLVVGQNKISREEARERAMACMVLTNIENLAQQKPGKLSGGQQQRVAITRALVQKPEVLLLDEPLSNLDARLRLKIREEIRRLVKEVGITTIFVTHDQEEALSISDQIILLNEGIIQQHDDPQHLYLEPNNLFVAQFIGNPMINLFPVTCSHEKLQHPLFDLPLEHFIAERFRDKLSAERYLLAVRPENLLISTPDQALFKQTVQSVELIGRDCVLNMRGDQQSIKSVISIEQAVTAGTELSFAIALDKAFIFQEDGVRIY